MEEVFEFRIEEDHLEIIEELAQRFYGCEAAVYLEDQLQIAIQTLGALSFSSTAQVILRKVKKNDPNRTNKSQV